MQTSTGASAANKNSPRADLACRRDHLFRASSGAQHRVDPARPAVCCACRSFVQDAARRRLGNVADRGVLRLRKLRRGALTSAVDHSGDPEVDIQIGRQAGGGVNGASGLIGTICSDQDRTPLMASPGSNCSVTRGFRGLDHGERPHLVLEQASREGADPQPTGPSTPPHPSASERNLTSKSRRPL